MIRSASELRVRCHNHPHRRATRRCFRCKRGLCEECVLEREGQAICDTCRDELDELYRITHVPMAERVRRGFLSFRNFVIFFAILGVIAVPLYFLVFRNVMQHQITPEEFARFRYAMTGTFETPEGTNVTSTIIGAQVVAATSEQPDFPARRLIDEYVGPAFPGWRTADAAFPQDVVIELANVTRPEKLYVVLPAEEPPETWVHELEVLAAVENAAGPYESIGRFTLEPTAEPQRFMLTPPVAEMRYLRLSVLSNRGGPYASLAEFNALLLPRMFFAPTPEAPTPIPRP